MASGMGMPSIGIYSYELYSFYGVENIIRVGSAGALDESLHVRDIVLGIGACTDSAFANQYGLPGNFAPTASYKLLEASVNTARRLGLDVTVGNLLSSDAFYNDRTDAARLWQKMGVLAVEMESAALYMTAARLKKRALAICTISDCIFTGEECSAADRQTSFTI